MPSRRRVLTSAAGIAAAAALPQRPGHAGSPRTLRLGYLLPAASQLGAGAAAMAEEVARRTGGRYRIRQFPDAALGGELDMLLAVQRGSLDLAFITGATLPNILPAAGIFDIPFLFEGPAHARAVLGGPIGDEYRQRFAAKDMVALAWGENGMRHITNGRHPVATPESLRDIRLRLPQSEVMLLGFKALGADVAPLPFPDLYNALRDATFDGQESPIGTVLAANFYRVQKFLTLTGHVYDPALMIMAQELFADLSAEDKTTFITAARLGAEASRRFADKAQESGIATLRTAGMQVITAIDRKLFAAAMATAAPVYEARFGHDEIEQIRQIA
jgi:tripartite ATP-independent transporter DctP family solute receptor